jgi:PAS domain S-box-containing protein
MSFLRPDDPPNERLSSKRSGPSLFEAVFEHATLAMLVADDDRRYVEANPAACALLGAPRSQILGKRIDDFSDFSTAEVAQAWRQFLADGHMAGDFFIRRADGERRLVEFHATANITPGQHLSLLRDVTDARRINDELLTREREARARAEESETRFRYLADQIPQFVFITAPDGTFLYVNERFVEYTGLDLGAMNDGRWAGSIHPEDLPIVAERWQACVTTGVPFEMEYRLRGAAGEYRWFLGRAVAHRDRSGAIAQLFGTSTDIEDQKRQQTELTTAAEFREQLLGIVGHDLRTPLATIAYAAATLLRRGSLNEPDARTVARIATSAERMAHIVDQTLDFTRSRLGGGIPISPGRADLAAICRQVAEEIELAHPGAQFQLSVEGDPQGTWDAQRLAQLASNLLVNAVQHGAQQRPVGVQVCGNGDIVELIVRNEGPPIAADLLPVVFEPFRRGHQSARAIGSLGLGLYIVRQIVVAHGGEVVADSTAADGTTFTVRLPRVARRVNPPTSG